MRRQRRQIKEEELIPKKKFCFFCKEKIEEVDYHNVDLLHRFLNFNKKIQPRSRTGVCARHQRQLSRAIKRARHLALIPFVGK